MGRNCTAYGCTNSHKKGYTVFKFPEDAKLRRVWILQVQRTRDKWRGPTQNSGVCSEHFTEDCYEPISVVSKQMGIKVKQMLKPNAIPTIFKRPFSTPKRLRSSSAVEKRKRAKETNDSLSVVHISNYYTFRYWLTLIWILQAQVLKV